MSNRQHCSFNKNIACDTRYELDEFMRQMQTAYESGKLVTFSTGTDKCPCHANQCPRYLAGKAKQISTNCPYDDTYCQAKAEDLAKFKERVHYLAENRVSQVFFQASDTSCPIEPASCLRYQRYLNIIKKIKANESQR